LKNFAEAKIKPWILCFLNLPFFFSWASSEHKNQNTRKTQQEQIKENDGRGNKGGLRSLKGTTTTGGKDAMEMLPLWSAEMTHLVSFTAEPIHAKADSFRDKKVQLPRQRLLDWEM
jgi:hypothetical protein